ncbi:hypothetical protein [Castellaniella sp.]|uniref:hypothetical protein n=1 Tax=Castellaniella sp. TaxID=1955812 RepID=UPI002AFF1223|nr:hypothetical protein [Castellaniella sp.]
MARHRPLPLILAIQIALAMGAGPARADDMACGPIDAVTGQAVADAPAIIFTGGLDAAFRQTCRELAQAADDTDPPACRIKESGAVGAIGATTTHYALYCLGPEAAAGACELRGAALFLEDRASGRISRFLTRLDEPDLRASAPSMLDSGGDIVLELPVSVSGAGAFDDNDVFVFEQDHWTRLDTQCWQDALARRLPHGIYIDKGATLNLGRLDAQAWLSRDGDAECCPTGGLAHVTLKRAGHHLEMESLRVDPEARPD